MLQEGVEIGPRGIRIDLSRVAAEGPYDTHSTPEKFLAACVRGCSILPMLASLTV